MKYKLVVGLIKSGDLLGLQSSYPEFLYNEPDDEGDFPLLVAAEAGHLHIVQWLAGLNRELLAVRDGSGRNALHRAVLSGNADLCLWLAENCVGKEIDLKDVDSEGQNSLHYLANNKVVAAEKALDYCKLFQLFSFVLAKAERPVFTQLDESGLASVHYLAKCGNGRLLQEYNLIANAPLDIKTADKRTIVHILAENGHSELIGSVLFSRQLSLVDRDAMRRTPFFHAAGAGQVNITLNLYRWSVNTGKNPWAMIDKLGRTPFSHAAASGQAAWVSEILEIYQQEKCFFQPDKKGHTPVLCAAMAGSKATIEVLRTKMGALLDDVDSKGRNALFLAIEYGHAHLVEWLDQEHPGLVEGKDKDGHNVLVYVVESGHLKETDDKPQKTQLIKYLLMRSPGLEKKRGKWSSHRGAILRAKKKKLWNVVKMLEAGSIKPPTGLLQLEAKLAGKAFRLAPGDLTWNPDDPETFLGAGSIGAVYQAQLYGTENVAVKQLLLDEAADNFQPKVVQRELVAMSKLYHPNIVHLYGYQVDQAQAVYGLVMECMALGPLHLKLANDPESFDGQVTYNLALDIARGLAYIHSQGKDSQKEKMVHRDLKPSSILLAEDPEEREWRAKISNFSVAKVSGMTTVKPAIVQGAKRSVSVKYQAPEVIECGTAVATSASDVYSFAMILWELLARQEAYRGMAETDLVDMLDMDPDDAGAVPYRESLDFPDLNPDDNRRALVGLIALCWAQEPDVRPSSEKVRGEIAAQYENFYAEPDWSDDDAECAEELPGGHSASALDHVYAIVEDVVAAGAAAAAPASVADVAPPAGSAYEVPAALFVHPDDLPPPSDADPRSLGFSHA